MGHRIVTNLVMVVSIATIAFVVFYFVRQIHYARERQEQLDGLFQISKEEGPCAGLEAARKMPRPMSFDTEHVVVGERQRLVRQLVGEQDPLAVSALLKADGDGLLDRTLCEQIYLLHQTGESHPVVELLRFTGEGGDPCERPELLAQALNQLSSHRDEMVHALLRDVSRLNCAPPWLSTRLAELVMDKLAVLPKFADDLDTHRLANFLQNWTSVRAAQYACAIQAESTDEPTLLARALGCTSEQLQHILPQFRCPIELTAIREWPPVVAGSEVALLSQEGERCRIRPINGVLRVDTVACSKLIPLSDVDMAVHLDFVSFGVIKAALVGGIARHDAARKLLLAPSVEPNINTWFAYDRLGAPLGMTRSIRLVDLAKRYGEQVPARPLTTFCQESGAKYCYDVDWAKVVETLPTSEAVIYLSRPLGIFLHPAMKSREQLQALWPQTAMRRPADEGSMVMYEIPEQGQLLIRQQRNSVEFRWRSITSQKWYSESFGAIEGGSAPSLARVMTITDAGQDGKPELWVQRLARTMDQGSLRNALDEILLYELSFSKPELKLINRLVVHEY